MITITDTITYKQPLPEQKVFLVIERGYTEDEVYGILLMITSDIDLAKKIQKENDENRLAKINEYLSILDELDCIDYCDHTPDQQKEYEKVSDYLENRYIKTVIMDGITLDKKTEIFIWQKKIFLL